MGGIASRRCDACRKLVMVSDRGDVETVGAARDAGTDRDGTDRAICVCGALVAWPRRSGVSATPAISSAGALANAHPRNGNICIEIGHDPLNIPPPEKVGGRLVTMYSICLRCAAVYGVDSYV